MTSSKNPSYRHAAGRLRHGKSHQLKTDSRSIRSDDGFAFSKIDRSSFLFWRPGFVIPERPGDILVKEC